MPTKLRRHRQNSANNMYTEQTMMMMMMMMATDPIEVETVEEEELDDDDTCDEGTQDEEEEEEDGEEGRDPGQEDMGNSEWEGMSSGSECSEARNDVMGNGYLHTVVERALQNRDYGIWTDEQQ